MNGDFFLSDPELEGRRVPPDTARDDTLYLWQVFSSAPSLRVKANQVVGVMDLLLGGPSRCPVLAVAHSAALDVQRIVLRDHGQPRNYDHHDNSKADQGPRTFVHLLIAPSIISGERS